eukprot:4249626-Heterocapsa_arctica.AAC.1
MVSVPQGRRSTRSESRPRPCAAWGSRCASHRPLGDARARQGGRSLPDLRGRTARRNPCRNSRR